MVKAEKLLILNLSTTSGRLSPLQIVSKTGIRPPVFGLVEMEPMGSIGESRFLRNLPHGLPFRRWFRFQAAIWQPCDLRMAQTGNNLRGLISLRNPTP